MSRKFGIVSAIKFKSQFKVQVAGEVGDALVTELGREVLRKIVRQHPLTGPLLEILQFELFH